MFATGASQTIRCDLLGDRIGAASASVMPANWGWLYL